ncbi:hypothetical protein HanIR_Chr03g0145901 [Helianthus annuus]|nr:hypothetical protein HanIR_Chr03g0145901 [Helianthus annuus]
MFTLSFPHLFRFFLIFLQSTFLLRNLHKIKKKNYNSSLIKIFHAVFLFCNLQIVNRKNTTKWILFKPTLICIFLLRHSWSVSISRTFNFS